jgi:hypothetical protein
MPKPSLHSFSVAGVTCLVAVGLSVALWKNFGGPRHRDDDDENDNDDGEKPRWSQGGGENIERYLPSHLKQEIHREKRRQEKIPLLAMKKPMYDNIRMLDPQGTLLCTISTKKAKWYVNKSLARWHADNQTAIQLLFEPSHRSNQSVENSKDEEVAYFNKSIKQNICVVCGHDKYHMRHYVVPYSCRSLLPNKYKQHMAHDVVILCPDCHLECKKQATERLRYLEKCCRKDPRTATPHYIDRGRYKIKSCALALLKWRNKLPLDTIDEYEALVRKHFMLSDEDDLTAAMMRQATDVEVEIPNPLYIPASKVIVGAFCQTDEDIKGFVKSWRKHFVSSMAPRFLPKGWDVDSNVQCLSSERKNG